MEYLLFSLCGLVDIGILILIWMNHCDLQRQIDELKGKR